jgi:hypothetical protein
MTHTSEMELFQLNRRALKAYSVEIEARALALLQTRAHNEWLARMDAEAEARYVRRWNKTLTWVVVGLVMVIVGMVSR